MLRHGKRIPVVVASVGAVAALVVAGCGSSNNNSGSSSASTPASTPAATTPAATKGAETVQVTAASGGQLRFDQTKLSVPKPGMVTIHMMNPTSSGMPHGIAIEGNGVDKDGPIVQAGKSSSVTVQLKKGTYTYYCPVPGHKQAGMTGTLKVG